MSQALLLLVFCFLLPIFQALPEPDPVKIHPFHPNPSPPETIPAFPEQSDVAGCPLNLPDELFHGIKTACSAGKGASGELRRSRCCPVLAAWLYSAYSGTALGRAKRGLAPEATPYDLPLLPDDSETCVNDLEKSLKSRGVELVKPNETCDVVYCFCGIRLHPLSCPEAFSVSSKGKLVGDESVKKLERDCLSTNGFPGLGGCSKCLNTLYLLGKDKTGNSSKLEARSRKMHNRDCELMGLTWLLAKNRTAYIHTVSAVLRAIMMSTDGSDPLSCTLNSDGMPLAVDSAEISSHSSSTSLHFSIHLCILSLSFLYAHLAVSFPEASLW
ncbi:hypothetical protein VitviT2T_025788 [Vitis vinifera]|uniref:SPARK domain-containing protein n=2 Tax=Vitis vinifera TaxID=29760 RepID=A0ABY9DN54_VITVI|nr:uncharacterized GPI-anchored protein At4g28100 [Vitis vinifera]WKA08025.1 hypothetical protein VitviT2T_025788 [Vitis vinifera]|eukprot:XP_003634199.1 PREDICTED: uncharacterized GPI-anchored protein At4g28100 [Vitis vinifera]